MSKHPETNGQGSSAKKRRPTPMELLAGFISVLALFVAVRQAYISSDTEQRSLRAYVFIEQVTVTLDGNTLKGVIDLKNGGQTPAYNVVPKTALYVEYANKPFSPRPLIDAIVSRGILGPGAVLNPRAEGPIPPEYPGEIAALKDGRLVIYYFGNVEYTDAFDRTWVLDFRARSYGLSGATWLMQLTEDGNKESRKEYIPKYRQRGR